MAEIEVRFDPKSLPDPKKMSDAFREVRDECLTEAQTTLKQFVDSAIQTSGVQDTHGKVRRWQKIYRSKGYAAVRAEATSTGANSPGAITNYLESGHRGRSPSGKAQRYTPRIVTGRARAFRFYKTADSQAKVLASDMEKRIAAELEKRLEETK